MLFIRHCRLSRTFSAMGGEIGSGEQSMLYLLETSTVASLAERLKTLTRNLEDIAAGTPLPWKVELSLKTVHAPAPQGVQRGVKKPQSTGENLYVIKTTENPGSCFMLATKQKTLMNTQKETTQQASTDPQREQASNPKKETTYSELVETGALGEEIMTLMKGYTNRLTMTLEGSSYTVAETIQASLGFFTRVNTLTSIALKVRYELTGATPEEAQRVLRQFVSGLLAGVGDDVKPRLIQSQLPGKTGGLFDYVQLFL